MPFINICSCILTFHKLQTSIELLLDVFFAVAAEVEII
jgi:hypothetical protein